MSFLENSRTDDRLEGGRPNKQCTWHLGVCLHRVPVQYGHQCIGCILKVMLAVCRTSGGWNGVREGTGLVNMETV